MRKLTIILLIFLPLYSCYDYEEYFEKVDPKFRPAIVVSPLKGVLANGVDSLKIKVFFPLAPNEEYVKVNFTTKEGVFFENNKAEYTSSELYRDGPNSTNAYIFATLKTTTKKGRHFISIEVPEVTKRILFIDFLASYPSKIATNKDKFAVSRTFEDEIQLIANLSALEGLPSEGTSVEFVVADSLSSTNSRLFRSLTKTDQSGQASVFFTPGLFGGYTGPVSYRAIATNETGDIISANGTFNVVEPEE